MTPLAEPVGLMAEACRGLAQVGISLALQSTLLLLAGLLTGRFLRQQGPAIENRVYRATLAAVVLVPLLSLPMGGRLKAPWSVALPPALGEGTAGALIDSGHARSEWGIAPPRAALSSGPGLGEEPDRGRASLSGGVPPGEDSGQEPEVLVTPSPAFTFPRLAPPRTDVTWQGWLYAAIAGLWGGGTVLLTGWLALGHWSLRRLRRAVVPAAESEAAVLQRLCRVQGVRPPPLLLSSRVRSPVLTGLFRPVILLPGSHRELFDPLALRAVLAHEVAHLSRGDCGWILLVRLVCAVAWMQPLLWLLGQRLEESSEAACDQEVVRQEGDPRPYARCLLDLAERLTPARRERAMGLGVASRSSSLERRVRQILSSTRRNPPPPSAPLLTVVGGGMLAVVGLSLLLAGAAAAPPDAPEPLAGDLRLEQKVRVTVEGLPVTDLLSLLSQKTGVKLVASPETADDKVIIFGPARPLREVLADLAALFNNRWERRKASDGSLRYALIRDAAARQYEAALAHAVTERMIAQLMVQVRALAETPEQLARRPEEDPIRKRLSGPKSRLATRLFGLLSPVQREKLFTQGRLSIRFAGLTAGQQQSIRDVFKSVIADEQVRSDEERKAGFYEPVSQPEDLEKTGFRFEIMHYQAHGWVYLLLGRSRIDIAHLDGRTRWLLPPQGNPYTGEKIAEDALLPSVQAAHAAAREKAWPDRLRKLADASGAPVMSDYYRSRPVTRPHRDSEFYRHRFVMKPDGAPAPAARLGAAASALDTLCEPEGYLWWTQGKTLLLRRRDWYQQRLREVPDRWMLSLIERLKAQGGIPSYADVLRVRELTREQIVGLNSLAGPWPFARSLPEFLEIVRAAVKDPSVLLPEPSGGSRGIRITYHSLPPAQRHLIHAFLEVYPYPVPPERAVEFRAGLRINPEIERIHAELAAQHTREPVATDPRCRSVLITYGFQLDGERRIWGGDDLYLPLSLPDDRRDRTRVELVP